MHCHCVQAVSKRTATTKGTTTPSHVSNINTDAAAAPYLAAACAGIPNRLTASTGELLCLTRSVEPLSCTMHVQR